MIAHSSGFLCFSFDKIFASNKILITLYSIRLPACEPLSAHLGALRGQHWRNMRDKLTSAFTPSQMKILFPLLLECGIELQRHLSKVINEKQAKSIEIYEIIACHASNITASIAFGIDFDCLADPNHPFRNATRQIFEINTKNILRFFGWFFQQTLLKWSGLRFVDHAAEEYFLKLITETLEMREKNSIVRKDFFQFLIETEQKSLTIEQVAGHAFAFLLAGVETTSFTTLYCLYEIAKQPDIQRKVNDEIDHVMAQYNGQLTYDSINKLKYLDCCLDGM